MICAFLNSSFFLNQEQLLAADNSCVVWKCIFMGFYYRFFVASLKHYNKVKQGGVELNCSHCNWTIYLCLFKNKLWIFVQNICLGSVQFKCFRKTFTRLHIF